MRSIEIKHQGICIKMSEEEEDLAVLIYKSSKTAKVRAAAAAAAKEKERMNTSAVGRRTSKRKRSSTNQEGEASIDHPGKKRAASRKQKFAGKPVCSADECKNLVINGGVCKRHGAKVKRCSSEGCNNGAKKEECVSGMEQRGNLYSKVVCAINMTKSKNLCRAAGG